MKPRVPRVSIVVPSYNNADYIDETMESILAQTFTDFELIVGDHSSTDGTWERLQRFSSDSRVVLIKTEPGGGAARNWNRVSSAASGELIKLVCGDDLLHPEILERQVEAMEQNPTAALVASPRSIVDAQGSLLLGSRGVDGLRGRHSGSAALRRAVRSGTNPFGEPACVLMRRADLDATGGWDGEWSYLIDQMTYTKVLGRGDMVGVGDTALASFRVSASQWSVRLARSQAAETIRYHQWIAVNMPGTASSSDLRRGRIMAKLNALMRRAVYLYLGRRMRRTAAR